MAELILQWNTGHQLTLLITYHHFPLSLSLYLRSAGWHTMGLYHVPILIQSAHEQWQRRWRGRIWCHVPQEPLPPAGGGGALWRGK